MQVALGYCITGRVSEKAMFVWWGPKGDNGKTTLIELLELCLGSYCKSGSKCLFIKQKSDSKLNSEREVLKDTRLVALSETGADDALNEDILKMVSGNDTIRVNPKYRNEYEFRSYAKILIATNNKPNINVADEAMVRRVKFIPFLTKFVDNPVLPNERRRDGLLVDRMHDDLLSAFFTWILDGSVTWYKTRLVDIPTVMQRATEEYLAENDEIGEFIADEMELKADGFIYSAPLYDRYCEWCRRGKLTPKGKRTFPQEIERRFRKERTDKGQRFHGLTFKVVVDPLVGT